ncbi:hypothetical protein KPATCC21470_0203 [Kitasatospora purpeofusca]
MVDRGNRHENLFHAEQPSSREPLLPAVQHRSKARSGICVRNSPPQLRVLSWFSAKEVDLPADYRACREALRPGHLG